MTDQQQPQPIVVNVNLTLGDLFEGLLKRKKAKATEKPKGDDWVKVDGPQPYAG